MRMNALVSAALILDNIACATLLGKNLSNFEMIANSGLVPKPSNTILVSQSTILVTASLGDVQGHRSSIQGCSNFRSSLVMVPKLFHDDVWSISKHEYDRGPPYRLQSI